MSPARRFPNGCVASPSYLASSAGTAVLASGGNALDAAIAANLVLGVHAPYMCGYGGDLFAIIWDGELHAYNGSGRSPAAATADAVHARTSDGRMPVGGPLSVTVPGAVEAWFTLLDRFGSRSFADLAQPALRYARDGWPLTPLLVAHFDAIARSTASMDFAAAWRGIYAGRSTDVPFTQPALARTIQTLIDDGPDAYYRGPIGEAIAATIQEFGGLMVADDVAEHVGNFTDTLSTTYRDVENHEMPPNTQGVAALEALNIVEELDLGAPETDQRHHVLIEAMKLALADRDQYVSDIDHMTIEPAELASKAWATSRRSAFDPARASSPAAGRAAVGGTIYLCAADRDGMMVSLIQSNFKGFGSGVTVGEWGINLQNRGASFSLDDQHVNVTAPRKRPMHTLMPGFAFRDGKPWMAFGTMGGDGQAQTHLQVLTRRIDDGMDIQDAIDAPRWVVSPGDWSVGAEKLFADDVVAGLVARGHHVHGIHPMDPALGHAHAIEVTPAGYAGATDRRADGGAIGH